MNAAAIVLMILALVVAVPAGVLFYRYPVISYVLALSSPYLKADPRLAFLNIINTTILFMAITIGVLAIRFFVSDRMRLNKFPPLPLIALVLLGGLMVMTLGTTPAPNYGLHKTVQFLTGGLFFFFAPLLIVRNTRDFAILMYGIIGLGVGLAVTQFAARGITTTAHIDALELGPIAVARVTGGAAIISLVYFASSRSQSWMARAFWLTLGGVLFVSMLLTANRATVILIFLSFGLAFLLAFQPRWPYLQFRNPTIIATVLIGAFVLIALLIWNPQGIVDATMTGIESLIGGRDNSSLARVSRYAIALDAWSRYPTSGLGIGGYAMYYAGIDEREYPHNIFLELGSELGWAGVILFVVVLVSRQAHAIRALRRQSTRGTTQALIAAEVLFWFYLGNAMVSADLTSNRMLLVTIGLSLAMASVAMRESRENGSSAAKRLGHHGNTKSASVHDRRIVTLGPH